MKKEMLINVSQPEECRIAIVENGVLEELFVERTGHESYVNNIYKGRIVNIEPSIQAAFVDFGVGRNGFLHVSDVEPAYYRHLLDNRQGEGRGRGEGRGEGRGGRDRDRDRDRGRGRGERGRGDRDRDRERSRRARLEAEEIAEIEEALQEEVPEYVPEPVNHEEAPVEETRTDFIPEEMEELPPEEPVEEAPAEEPEPAAPEPAEEAPAEEAAPARATRKRSRGSRTRQRAREEPAAEEAPAEEPAAASEAAAPAEEEEPPAEPRGRVRPMDSAERRTSEEDYPETNPPSDEDIFFFPRPEPRREEPAAESRIEEEEERSPRSSEVAEAPSVEESPREREEEEDEYRTPRSEFPEEEEEEAEASPPEEDQEDALRAAEMEGDRFEEDVDYDIDEEYTPRRGGEGRGGRDRDRDRDRRGGRGRGGPRRGFGGRSGFGRPKPLIQDIFKRGQEVIVQVIKEGMGTKGPTLSTFISIPGRYLVLMPHLNRTGVSRKIQDEEQRRRLKETLNELNPPKGLGFIIRTAGKDRQKKELQRDLAYLTKVWQVVVRRIKKLKGPAEIYQESDMVTRTIRDTFTSDIDTIWVDDKAAFEAAQEFMQIVMPRYADRIKLYEGTEPMFHKYGIEQEITRIQQKHVPLPNGGSIVIEPTEALVAIDVNSGNFRADNNAEETAYQMNLLAAKEIARQLRLRNLGGVIVNDFIDMREEKHKRGVERALRDALRRDRFRTKILKTSAFGIIEMTRQRSERSLKRSIYTDCPHCQGSGQVKTSESLSIEAMRMLHLAAHREQIRRVEVRVAQDVGHYLLNKKRKEIVKLEEEGQIQVVIHGVLGAPPDTLEILCFDNNNNEVRLLPVHEERVRRR